MNFKRYHVSRNLFDKSTVTHGYYISDSNGNMNTSSTYEQEANASDYIPISGDSVTIYSNPVGKWRWGAFYDSNKTYISGISGYNRTVTIPENARYMRLTVVDDTLDTLMVNLGSTALPYEPYSSEVWHDTPHYIHNTSTDTITTLPAKIYPNAATATVGLKGDMSQSSTSTPTTPIQPQECGDKTANLFDKDATNVNNGYIDNGYVRSDGSINTNTDYRVSEYIRISQNQQYNLYYGTYLNNPSVCFYDSAKNYISGIAYAGQWDVPFTTPQNAEYLRLSFRAIDTSKIILNLGSVRLPYEPYGVKIPISSASTTTPIYLGEVETERQIKKLVLTGEENFNIDTFLRFSIYVTDIKTSTSRTGHSYCSHYECLYHAEPYDNNWNNVYYQSGGTLYFHDRRFATVADFKTYLAQQYTNGTPVTIWYILATPTTGIVNEPLRKIGDYADTVSGISIPTIAGGDTLSVGTTLQPSEVTVNYKGWHPVSAVHERENGQWD